MLQDQSLDLFLESYLGDNVQREECFRGILEEEETREKTREELEVRTARAAKLDRRTWITIFGLLVVIPLTILVGNAFLEGRKYYFISMVIIVYSLVPFLTAFEGRKPKARELIIVAVLSALAVAGRAVFFMVPNFKPVVAIIVLTGVSFGGEAGFLVGSTTALISNFFFGQGPWTPWQMFAWGLIGLLAGVLAKKRILTGSRVRLCIYGFFSVMCIHCILMNMSSVLMFSGNIRWETILAIYTVGIPGDLMHAVSTVFFLWIISDSMLEKLTRVKKKYGLVGM